MSFTEILFQMVEAVEEMHMHGFAHHDIKPGNFCINNNRVVLGYL
jgi:serine/threonine protein kinase